MSDKTENPCEMSVEDHTYELLELMFFAGLGGACENYYKALLEVAQTCKILHNHPDYTPVLAEKIAAEALSPKDGELTH